MAKTPTFLTLTGEGAIWPDRTGLDTISNFIGEVMFTEANLGNVAVGLLVYSGGNSAAVC